MADSTLVPQDEQRHVHSGNHELDLASRVEALLFVAEEPVDIPQLARALGEDESVVEAALEGLIVCYEKRGLRLQQVNREVQFVTAPEAAPDVERFLGLEARGRLSTAALEALALIAYQQPITRAQIEATRGVNCDGVLRTLVSHGLIVPVGRLEQVGRPILYGTTFEFLQYFGLSNLNQLPPLEGLVPGTKGDEPSEPGRTADQTTADEKV